MSPVERGFYALAFAEAHGVQVNISRLGVEVVYRDVPPLDLCAMFCDEDESIRGVLPFAPLERLNRHVSRVAWGRFLQ
jgi:hypothetical protein